jgi:thioredoxin reductase
MMIPTEVMGLDLTQTPVALHLDDGRRVKASTVVVATGARYRRLDVPNLRDFEGRGVWYWASPIEARLCRNEEIVLVGGGNSAAQAAVFLRNFAKKIWMLVRGPGLADSMSQYLIDRIRASDNIEVLTHTEIVALYGSREKQLERVQWRNNVTGEETEKPIRHVFLFIGADPATSWLRGRFGSQEFRFDGIGRSIRRPPVEQRFRPSSVAGNQHSRRVRRRRRAVRISQAGRRRNRRGGGRRGGATYRSCKWRSCVGARRR